MGNWHISVQGIGAHHNAAYPKDANRMAARFVQELREAGHTVESATFTHGALQDISVPMESVDVAKVKEAEAP